MIRVLLGRIKVLLLIEQLRLHIVQGRTLTVVRIRDSASGSPFPMTGIHAGRVPGTRYMLLGGRGCQGVRYE